MCWIIIWHNSHEVFEVLYRIICAMLLFLEIGWVALICRSRRRYCCSWIPCSPYQSRTLCNPWPEEWRALEKYQLVFPLRVHTCKLKILKLCLHIHRIEWWTDAVWAEPSRLLSSPQACHIITKCVWQEHARVEDWDWHVKDRIGPRSSLRGGGGELDNLKT